MQRQATPWLSLALSLLVAAGLSNVSVKAEPAEQAPSLEVVQIILEPAATGSLSRVRVRLHNRSTTTLAGWAFELHVLDKSGDVTVDGYQDVLFLQPAAPDETITIELYRLFTPREAFALEVAVLEAWAADKVSGDDKVSGEGVSGNGVSGDGVSGDTWRLLEPIEGLPILGKIEVKVEVKAD